MLRNSDGLSWDCKSRGLRAVEVQLYQVTPVLHHSLILLLNTWKSKTYKIKKATRLIRQGKDPMMAIIPIICLS